MENPSIKTEVRHSLSKNAWNIIGTSLGSKYKIALVPYLKIEGDQFTTEMQRSEALRHAKFISFCFNNSEAICNKQLSREFMDRYCETCKTTTSQDVKLKNPDNPEDGEVWECVECKQNTGWAE